MRKITDFIVEKRIFILVTVFLLCFLCCFTIPNVKINRDISKYLPKNSNTKIGISKMEEEFKDSPMSSFLILFKDLKEDEKIEKELKKIEKVKEVEIEKKKDYTLFSLTVLCEKDSKDAKKVYDTITEKYSDQYVAISGDIVDEFKTILPLWIVALAITSALLILIFLSDSYFLPFLYFFTIGLAIILNKGTNIIFPTVSSITDSITAILQLALSMDYSIMLSSRYEQEKRKEKDSKEAMKKALYKSFLSISSSSVTTIVGLLALVFMSFTIGKDLGFVLAKGVLFSLLTIFTCLPALLLLFEKTIAKTKKKAPKLNLTKFGTTMFSIRKIAIPLSLLIFVISFLLKGNLTILYTDSEQDEISKIFNDQNQMALIYNNEEEDKIAKYCKKIDQNSKIKEVLCYGTTIHEKLPYNELKERLKELGSSVEIEDYLLKIIYYHYYNKEEDNKMTFSEFVSFVKENVNQNETLKEKVTNDMMNDINLLENFVNPVQFKEKKTLGELASVFQIKEEEVEELLIYYHYLFDDTKTKMTINQFVSFINQYVRKSNYQNQIPKESLQQIDKILPFLDQNKLQQELTVKELSNLFGLDQDTVTKLFYLAKSKQNSNTNLTLYQFSSYVNHTLLTKKEYQNLVDTNTKEKLLLLEQFSNKEEMKKKKSAKEMAELFSMKEQDITSLYLLFASKTDDTKLTLKEFLENAMRLKKTSPYLKDFDTSSLEQLSKSPLLQSDRKYSARELAKILNMEDEKIALFYTLVRNEKDTITYTPYEFLSYLLQEESVLKGFDTSTIENLKLIFFVMESGQKEDVYSYQAFAKTFSMKEETIKSIYTFYDLEHSSLSMKPMDFLSLILETGQGNREELLFLQKIMKSVIENKSYTKEEMASFLTMEKDQIGLLYSLYDVKYQQKEIPLSYQEFVSFLLKDVLPKEEYGKNFSKEQQEKLRTLNGIMIESEKNTKYQKEELFAILTPLTNGLKKDFIDLLYLYYGSVKNYHDDYTLTIEEFVTYLNGSILEDERFQEFLDQEKRDTIKDAKDMVMDAKKMLVGKHYSRVVLDTYYQKEGKNVFSFLKQMEKDLNKEEVYFVGNSPMAYDMSKSFGSELNFITILTIVFIFLVVFITFRSFLIPLLLVAFIQTAVYLIMGILSLSGGSVYFIALLIVQSILMGATIDYAILYTSYYLEARRKKEKKEAMISAYNKSIHTILTSASILILVTYIVGQFSSAITSKICMTISQGTLCSTLLILLLLPTVLTCLDQFIVKKSKKKRKV